MTQALQPVRPRRGPRMALAEPTAGQRQRFRALQGRAEAADVPDLVIQILRHIYGVPARPLTQVDGRTWRYESDYWIVEIEATGDDWRRALLRCRIKSAEDRPAAGWSVRRELVLFDRDAMAKATGFKPVEGLITCSRCGRCFESAGAKTCPKCCQDRRAEYARKKRRELDNA